MYKTDGMNVHNPSTNSPGNGVKILRSGPFPGRGDTMNKSQILAAEALGTFMLVMGGPGTAVLVPGFDG